MAEKFTVEMKGQGLKDLKQIAGLCKESPEELLSRAFREWVEIREYMDDIKVSEEVAAREREGEYFTHEEVMKELGLRKPGAGKPLNKSRRSRGSRVRS